MFRNAALALAAVSAIAATAVTLSSDPAGATVRVPVVRPAIPVAMPKVVPPKSIPLINHRIVDRPSPGPSIGRFNPGPRGPWCRACVTNVKR